VSFQRRWSNDHRNTTHTLETNYYAQSWAIVFQRDAGAMLPRNGRNQAQAEPAALAVATRLQAVERAKDTLSLLLRNAAAVVGNSQARRAAHVIYRHIDSRTGSTVEQRIVQEIDRHLHEQFAVSIDQQPGLYPCTKLLPSIAPRGRNLRRCR